MATPSRSQKAQVRLVDADESLTGIAATSAAHLDPGCST